MTDEQFAEIINSNHERRGLEFKGPGPRTDKHLFAKVVRAVLGMANRQDGGLIIIGVTEDSGTPTPVGVLKVDLPTWQHDHVCAGLNVYADPHVVVETDVRSWEGRDFVVIRVSEFESIPVLCCRDYQAVLRAGACYVRSGKKPETSEIPTQTEMRELLDLAVQKGLRKFMSTAKSAGAFDLMSEPSDADRFADQAKDMFA